MTGLILDPGEMTERVTIRQKSSSSDGGGGGSVTWSDLDTVWAKVKPMRGDDRLAAEQVEARRDYEITIRWRDDLADDMAILWLNPDGTTRLTFGIRFIADFGKRAQFMRIEAQSGLMVEADADG